MLIVSLREVLPMRLRSPLFAPGDSERKMTKAIASDIRFPISRLICDRPKRWVIRNLGAPTRPRLVVMIITPLAAFDP